MLLRSWRSARLFVFVLLTAAVFLGAHYRFHRLARSDMNADEAASWAGAIAPSVKEVAAVERHLDPGKLPLYDLLLHGWILLFGDSLFSMRGMSAGLGTLAIVLVFFTVRETCRSLGDESIAEIGQMAGAFAALIYSTNIEMVASDRTTRMYALLMCLELLQILCFIRAQRCGGLLNYGGAAIFTALMIATNFTATFLLMGEGLWLGCLLLGKGVGARVGELAIFRPAAALAVGIMLLAPMMPGAIASSAGAVRVGALDWITLQPISWPYTTLRSAAGSRGLFRLFVALGLFGVWCQWRSARLVSGFFGAWTMGPIIAVMLVTYLIKPLEFPRYVVISFVGMFAFTALGAASVRSTALRIGLAAVLTYASMRPVHNWIRSQHEVAWREATAFAAERATPREQIAVFPSWTVNTARFYFPPERRSEVVGVDTVCGPAPLLIITGRNISPPKNVVAMENCYPNVLERFYLIEVRSR